MWNLDKVPTGVSDDELGFILNSKAVFLTGSNLIGNWSPISLTPVTGEFPQAELPYLITAPIIGLLPLSLGFSKIPYVLIGVGFVLLLYLIAKKLFGKNEALFVGLVAAINPWSIFFSRTAYEAPLAIFFYLLSFYILLIAKGWKIIIAFIPLFIGFYSYMGTKILFLPFVVVITFYSWRFINNKKYLNQYLMLIVFCIALFVFFSANVRFLNTSERLAELATPFTSEISRTVDAERRLSVDNPLTDIFSNKAVIWAREVATKSLKVYSTELQFVTGESRSTFSLWYHGYFYYIDFFFLITGLLILFSKNRKIFLLFVAFLVIAPIPTIASNSNTGFAALRSSLLYPVFILIIGYGIYSVSIFIKSKKIRNIFYIGISLIYIIHLLNFINIYFFRNPIYNAEAFNLSARVLSKYITLADEKDLQVVVVSNFSKMRFYHYLFDTNSYESNSAMEIRSLLNQKSYQLNNVRFIQCLSGYDVLPNTIYIVDSITGCLPNNKSVSAPLYITQINDGAQIYKIYNDNICINHTLDKYPSNFAIGDFDVENLSEKRFCEKFIVDPNIK